MDEEQHDSYFTFMLQSHLFAKKDHRDLWEMHGA